MNFNDIKSYEAQMRANKELLVIPKCLLTLIDSAETLTLYDALSRIQYTNVSVGSQPCIDVLLLPKITKLSYGAIKKSVNELVTKNIILIKNYDEETWVLSYEINLDYILRLSKL